MDECIVREHNHKLQVRKGNEQYLFDRSGRFLLFVAKGHVVRRGLDHRMLDIRIPSSGGLPARRYREIPDTEKTNFLTKAYQIAQKALQQAEHALSDKWTPVLSLMTVAEMSRDKERFSRTYLPVSILPPDQYHSLVIQVAHGCSYNRCLFCDFYRDRPFHIKSPEELQHHLAHVLDFLGKRIDDRTGIFLGDGNALIIPTDRLLRMIHMIKSTLGEYVATSFHTFMDTFNLDYKSMDELRMLHEIGLQTVYVGFETGADRLRQFLDKPGTSAEAVEAVTTLKMAGYRVGVILLIGAGGTSFVQEHRTETWKALLKIPFTSDDIIFLSPFYMPEHTAYHAKIDEEGLCELSDEQMEQEIQIFKEKLSTNTPATITMYSIKEHLY